MFKITRHEITLTKSFLVSASSFRIVHRHNIRGAIIVEHTLLPAIRVGIYTSTLTLIFSRNIFAQKFSE